MDEISSVVARISGVGAILAGVVLAWLLAREKENWDTSMICRGQRYLFQIHITLQNAEQYDLKIYSNNLYDSITDIGIRTSFFKVSRRTGHIRNRQWIKIIEDERETWIRSDDISTVSLKILDSQLQDTDHGKDN